MKADGGAPPPPRSPLDNDPGQIPLPVDPGEGIKGTARAQEAWPGSRCGGRLRLALAAAVANLRTTWRIQQRAERAHCWRAKVRTLPGAVASIGGQCQPLRPQNGGDTN